MNHRCPNCQTNLRNAELIPVFPFACADRQTIGRCPQCDVSIIHDQQQLRSLMAVLAALLLGMTASLLLAIRDLHFHTLMASFLIVIAGIFLFIGYRTSRQARQPGTDRYIAYCQLPRAELPYEETADDLARIAENIRLHREQLHGQQQGAPSKPGRWWDLRE